MTHSITTLMDYAANHPVALVLVVAFFLPGATALLLRGRLRTENVPRRAISA
jgi:hypothetical protein